MENDRIALESVDQDLGVLEQEMRSVLYASPITLSSKQSDFITNKYSEMIDSDSNGNRNVLSYQSLKKMSISFPFISQFVSKLYSFSLFLFLMRAQVKSYKTVHLFMFTSVSFLFQMIPLLVLGKFYRKNVVIEFIDFNNFYYPEETRTFIRFFLQVANSVIVPTGHQCRSLRQKKINASTFKTEFNAQGVVSRVIEDVQPKILVSACFEDILNINCILEAYLLVKRKYPRTELILSGDGSLKEDIQNLTSSNSYAGVSIVDSEESDTVLKESDIFVHCYHIEYFAEEILRAMAHGIPVIASPIGMVKGMIQNENILMYQFNDYSTLADQLLLLIENSSITNKISLNGASYVKELSLKEVQNNYTSFYQNLS